MAYTTPADLQYAKSHEWLKVEGDTATVGITDYAQHALGDIVFVELPDVGSSFEAGSAFGVVESVKAASDIYAPVTGEIVERNDDAVSGPEVVNASPYEQAWLVRIRVGEQSGLDNLMSADEYEKYLEEVAQ